MNTVSIVLDNKQTINSSSFTNSEKNDDFITLIDFNNYDLNLENVLDTLSDTQKEAHLKTLEKLEEEGYSKEELNIINLQLLFKNKLEELKLTGEQQELVNKYDSMFKDIYKAIQEKREEKLNLKPLQMEQMMTDTMLKALDIKENIIPNEHKLNIEI